MRKASLQYEVTWPVSGRSSVLLKKDPFQGRLLVLCEPIEISKLLLAAIGRHRVPSLREDRAAAPQLHTVRLTS